MTYFCLMENGCVCYQYLLSTGAIEMATFGALEIRLRVSQGYSRLKGEMIIDLP